MTGQVFSSLMHTQVVRPRDDLAKALKHTLVEDWGIIHFMSLNPFLKVCEVCQIPGYGHLKRCSKLRLLRKLEKVMGYIDDLEKTEVQKNFDKQSFILTLEQLDGEQAINQMVDGVIRNMESLAYERMVAEIKADQDAYNEMDRIRVESL